MPTHHSSDSAYYSNMSHQQPLANMLSSLSISGQPGSPPRHGSGGPSSASSSSNPALGQTKQSAPRLNPLMTKYMDPKFVRAPNQALAARSAGAATGQNQSGMTSESMAAARAPLLKLAGSNTSAAITSASAAHPTLPSKLGTTGVSPRKLVPTQHTAHGLHGPAHATGSRAMASAIQPQSRSGNGGIGKYDGGLERDWERKEAPTGEGAELLNLDDIMPQG